MTRLVIAILLLAGCAPTIQSASPEHVTINYDGMVMRPEDTAGTAASACAQYGKQAKLISDIHSAPESGIPDALSQRIATWKCVSE